MKTVRRFEKFDFSKDDLAKPQVTDEGYWVLDGRVARTGIQIYKDAQGGERRELRKPEDVKASVGGFNMKPLTNGHPPALVTPDTARAYVAGAVGEAEFNDGWVRAPMTVWTKDAIEAIKSGRAQLSVGYSCEVVDEPGEWNGQRYDSFQKNITVNHVALVDVARAGPGASLRLDEGDACSADFGHTIPEHVACAQTQGESRMPLKMKLDGFEVEVADANAMAIVERAIETARKDGEQKAATERARAESAEKQLAEEKGARERADAAKTALAGRMGKCDECDGSGKCDSCGGTGKLKMDDLMDDAKRASMIGRIVAKRVDAEVGARVALLTAAKALLPTNYVADGKSNLEVKRDLVKVFSPEFKGDTEAKIDGAYEALGIDAKAKAKAEPASAIDAARTVTTTVVSDGAPVKDPNAARQRMIDRSRKINTGK